MGEIEVAVNPRLREAPVSVGGGLSAGAAHMVTRTRSLALLEAADSGDLGRVQALLDEGANPNTKRKGKLRSARWSCAINDWTDQQFEYGASTLLLAARGGHVEIARLLLDRGAKVDGRENVHGLTALMEAAGRGHEEIVALLIDRGARVDLATRNYMLCSGSTALAYAAGAGFAGITRRLLDAGADPNRRDKYGGTPLLHAAENGHTEIVDLLLKRGGDPNLTGENRVTALIRAASMGHREIVAHLLDAGADPNAVCDSKRGALDFAEWKGYREIASLLREAGAMNMSQDET